MRTGTPPPAVLVWSGKGGVGKSTVACALARTITRSGLTIGYLDADFHGPSAPTLFGAQGPMRTSAGRIRPVVADGVHVVSSGFLGEETHAHVWFGLLLEGAMDQLCFDTDWSGCDVLVVDLPPGTGEIQTGLLRRLDVACAVVVTTPDELSYADVARSAHMLRDAEVPVGVVVENMATAACPSCSHEFSPFTGDAGRRTAALFRGAEVHRLPLSGDQALVRASWEKDPGISARMDDIGRQVLLAVDVAGLADPPQV